MNRLEEIQEIIKNFIYEKQQRKQQITEIERKRTQLAQKRNERKSINENVDNAYAKNAEAEVCELGKQITELGNQSQDLQNKLDARFLEVKEKVNTKIDNLIAEDMEKIREIEEKRLEIEKEISCQEARNARYEIQKQEFFARFGRMPELSENAQKENRIKEEECCANKSKISEVDVEIKKLQEEISELATNKREFKNGNWDAIIKVEEKSQINYVEEVQEETEIENLEEQIESLVADIIEEQKVSNQTENVTENEKVQNDNIQEITEEIEESITLPLTDIQAEEIKIEEFQPIEEIEIEDIAPIEEIQVEEIEPIEEVQIEEFQPIGEVQIDEIEPIEEIKIEEFEPVEEIKVEEFKPVEEIKVEEFETVEKFDKEEVKTEEIEVAESPKIEEQQEDNIQKIVEEVEKVVENIEKEQNDNIQEASEEIEEEIIISEENEKEQEVQSENTAFGEKINLLSIMAKIEDGEVVYKAQTSNGKTIKIHPTRANAENILLKDKENREELKEILINYAIAEYRTLDKKVIKKIDPIVCEILVKFAKEYNYDAQNLIYNYAMSFSKNEETEIDAIPQITYNFSFIEETQLSKKEKEILLKICKNARKNEKIEIIGYNTGIKKIKYIFKRTFTLNDANALPEGKC